MKLLFFDTETNGLPANRYASVEDGSAWPRMLQLSWEMWELRDGKMEMISTHDYYIKPEPEMVWNKESATFHKISHQFLQDEGRELKDALDYFYEDLEETDAVIAHNLWFDRNVLGAELCRTGNTRWPKGKLEICTMMGCTGLVTCGLNKAGKPKVPRLIEMHTFLLGALDCSGSLIPIEWHNAVHDVHCLVLCFQALIQKGYMRQVCKNGLISTSRPATTGDIVQLYWKS